MNYSEGIRVMIFNNLLIPENIKENIHLINKKKLKLCLSFFYLLSLIIVNISKIIVYQYEI
mgnify:CR=1 FL=1